MFTYNKNINKNYISKSDKIQPTDEDYKNGYINRYFLKSTSDKYSGIFEVNEKNYNKFKNNQYYKNIIIKWFISGDKNTVSEKNLKNIKNSLKFEQEILYLLINSLEFYK